MVEQDARGDDKQRRVVAAHLRHEEAVVEARRDDDVAGHKHRRRQHDGLAVAHGAAQPVGAALEQRLHADDRRAEVRRVARRGGDVDGDGHAVIVIIRRRRFVIIVVV